MIINTIMTLLLSLITFILVTPYCVKGVYHYSGSALANLFMEKASLLIIKNLSLVY